MHAHRNAKLGLAGRFSLVRTIEGGCSNRDAARRHGVTPATACGWWHRWRAAAPDERARLACLQDRSSRPCRMPRLLSTREQERICEARRKTGWGPRLLAGRLGHPHATISKTLQRNGCSRRARVPREPANGYEWPCPGDLLHMDSSSYARFERPGHAVTGNRSRTGAELRTAIGYEYAHAVVDDHSRFAYAELLPDERAATVVAFTERALTVFERHGIRAKRVMTDNAWCYTRSRAFRELLARPEIKHLKTKAYRPRTNGKVERFHQTMAREWAYRLSYRSSTAHERCHTGSTTTTRADRTARSEASRRSAAFATSVGMTASQPTNRAGHRRLRADPRRDWARR
jgi:transposase InsO family protein